MEEKEEVRENMQKEEERYAIEMDTTMEKQRQLKERFLQDTLFRKAFLANPKKILQQYGIEISDKLAAEFKGGADRIEEKVTKRYEKIEGKLTEEALIVLDKKMEDPEFRRKFYEDPVGLLQKFGIGLPTLRAGELKVMLAREKDMMDEDASEAMSAVTPVVLAEVAPVVVVI